MGENGSSLTGISIGRNLILKYCPRIIFYIKNNPLEKILWMKK
jgi:hypothetical protein